MWCAPSEQALARAAHWESEAAKLRARADALPPGPYALRAIWEAHADDCAETAATLRSAFLEPGFRARRNALLNSLGYQGR